MKISKLEKNAIWPFSKKEKQDVVQRPQDYVTDPHLPSNKDWETKPKPGFVDLTNLPHKLQQPGQVQPQQQKQKSPSPNYPDYDSWMKAATALFGTMHEWKVSLAKAAVECDKFTQTVGGLEGYNKKSSEVFGFTLIDEESSKLFDDFSQQLHLWTGWMEEYQNRIFSEHRLDFKGDLEQPQQKAASSH